MASPSHNQINVVSPPPQPSFPVKSPKIDSPNPNPNPKPNTQTVDKGKSVISPSQPDANPSGATKREIMERRLKKMKQLAKTYREHYWALMEEFRAQYRDYVWKFGLSPFLEDNEGKDVAAEGEGSSETNANALSSGGGGGGCVPCAATGCKYKAMALTGFCKRHILMDPKQQLYKPCDYVLKSALAGDITCGKPILKSILPSLCDTHFVKAQAHVNRALKKAGLNVSASSKISPKLHVIMAEYVREIQNKRRVALKKNILEEAKNEKSC